MPRDSCPQHIPFTHLWSWGLLCPSTAPKQPQTCSRSAAPELPFQPLAFGNPWMGPWLWWQPPAWEYKRENVYLIATVAMKDGNSEWMSQTFVTAVAFTEGSYSHGSHARAVPWRFLGSSTSPFVLFGLIWCPSTIPSEGARAVKRIQATLPETAPGFPFSLCYLYSLCLQRELGSNAAFSASK